MTIRLSGIVSGLTARLGLRTKLFIAFAVFVTIPLVSIAFRSFTTSSAIIYDKASQYTHDILSQTAMTLESRIGKIEDVSFSVILNPDVQETLLDMSRRDPDALDDAQNRRKLEGVLASHVFYHQEIDAIILTSTDGKTYELDKQKETRSLPDAFPGKVDDAKGGVVWFGQVPKVGDLVVARDVYSLRNQKKIGSLVLYVDADYLEEVIANTQSVEEGTISLIDGSGTVTVAGRNAVPGSNTGLVATPPGNYSFGISNVAGVNLYVASSAPLSNGWSIVTGVPVDRYQREIIKLRRTIVISCAFLIPLYVIVAWLVAYGVTRPIIILAGTISRFGKGDLAVRCPELPGDESRMLGKAFNDMADDINDLVEKVYAEQGMKRDAELRSLRMQINPHFLYNTLDTINWLARSQGAESIGELVKALGDLLRSTIDGKDSVTLNDEIQSLRNYVRIQKYRYGDRLTINFDIDSATSELLVPKLILQPLIENSIYHGIEQAYGNGEIRVSSSLDSGTLILRIEDNGVGMTEDQLRVLNQGTISDDTDKNDSIGVNNVRRRIHTLFGENCGLAIDSELGEGTIVTVRIPAGN